MMPISSSMLDIKVAPADRDTQASCLWCTLNYISIYDFYQG